MKPGFVWLRLQMFRDPTPQKSPNLAKDLNCQEDRFWGVKQFKSYCKGLIILNGGVLVKQVMSCSYCTDVSNDLAPFTVLPTPLCTCD